MRRKLLVVAVIIFCVAVRANADGLTLTDGETLQGTLLEITGGVVHFKSTTLGPLAVPIKNIASLSTTGTSAVLLNNGSTLQGTLSLKAGGQWTISEGGKSKTFAIGDVADILPQAAFQARLAGEHAKLWQAWKGAASTGYNLQQGATKTHSLALNINASRQLPTEPHSPPRWSTDTNLALLFASTRQDGIIISSNTMTASVRENYSVTKEDFLFILAQADHIETQNLYLRQTYGGGLGREVIQRPFVSWSVLGGLTFVNEKFSGPPANQYAETLVGESLHLHLTKAVMLDHYLHFYSNLSSQGNYRFDTSAMISMHLMARLTANLGTTDYYASHVAAGSPISAIGPTGALITLAPSASKNNFAFTAGVGVTF